MRSDRNFQVLAILAITLAVGGLSVGFAAFSRTLTITPATTEVTATNWDVSFDSISAPTLVGEATANTPSIVSGTTSITGINMTLSKPGDSISYNIEVTNNGDFDAEAASVQIGTPVCDVASDTAHEDAVNVCSNITYTLTYVDGSSILTTPELTAGQTKMIKLTLSYDIDTLEEELPNNTVNVTGLASSILYNQS